ncbi:MAG: hypothetical protein KA184_00020 [Candidatus Hydrogenedentes bacterium]|nr:hypothetical protein [Candidatus Hydrogenedentota bacterium]
MPGNGTEGERLRIRCPNCEATFQVRPEMMGRTGPCKTCKELFTITPELVVQDRAAATPPGPGRDSGVSRVPGQGPAGLLRTGTPVPGPTSAAVAAPSGTQPAAVPAQTEGAVLASASHGYSFRMTTPGWKRYHPRDEKVLEADIFIENPGIGSIKCVVYPCDVGMEELDSRLEEAYNTEVQKFKCHQHGRTTIAGFPGSYIDYQGIAPGEKQSTRFLSFVFVKDGKSFQVIGMGEPARFPQLRQEVQQVAKSLSFDPAQAALATAETLPAQTPATLQRLLLPPAAFIFVPAGFVLGLLIYASVREDVSHFSSFGKLLTYMWWLIYPLIGYYVAMGWEGSGYPGARVLREWATQVAILGSDMFVMMFTMIMGMFIGGAARGFGALMRAMNRAMIQAGALVFGRLASAWVVALPQLVWQAWKGGQPLGVGGSFLMHAAGLIPGLIVFSLFFVPMVEQSDYQMQRQVDGWRSELEQPQPGPAGATLWPNTPQVTQQNSSTPAGGNVPAPPVSQPSIVVPTSASADWGALLDGKTFRHGSLPVITTFHVGSDGSIRGTQNHLSDPDIAGFLGGRVSGNTIECQYEWRKDGRLVDQGRSTLEFTPDGRIVDRSQSGGEQILAPVEGGIATQPAGQAPVPAAYPAQPGGAPPAPSPAPGPGTQPASEARGSYFSPRGRMPAAGLPAPMPAAPAPMPGAQTGVRPGAGPDEEAMALASLLEEGRRLAVEGKFNSARAKLHDVVERAAKAAAYRNYGEQAQTLLNWTELVSNPETRFTIENRIVTTEKTKIWVRDVFDGSVHEASLGETLTDGYVFESLNEEQNAARLEKDGVFYNIEGVR